ncbi:aryl-alcohol oxidase-like protein [Obba rivulosa]|uniref:Aryl-alcohol oxidase-like protein n=1 Tax=Obba rivulosa TaxID=1052685 RepID=A0A8E2DJ12_9APHY|nr:aryl-alcohol oxidase-like protein [Obba rivulosa]
MFLPSLICALLILRSARAELYTDPSQLTKSEYDFVVVGAGTAGNVIATRLTEESSFSVLVVEAGISNVGILAAEIPFLGQTLSPDTSVTWNFTTTPQAGLDGRVLQYPRGRVLGGSSTINFEIWTRASEDDWNRYADATGDNGWSWSEILPYMKKSESLVAPTDHHNTTGEVNPSVHGTSGPIQISLPGFPSEIDERIINTTQELPSQFPYNEDMNSGVPLGVGWTQCSVGTDGHRSSSATAYLEPALTRSNLDVLIMTTVTKLTTSSNITGVPHFDTIEIAQSPSSDRFQVTATKEIILSAGAVNTPQLLLLSGIGNSTALSALGITPLVELPDVGQHLADHPFLGNHWFVNSTDTLESIARNATLEGEDLTQWEANGTGQFSDPGANQIVYSRLSGNEQPAVDASAGPLAAQFEILPVNGFVSFIEATPNTGNFLTLATAVVSPVSRGSITLASNDPFADPIIDPGLLSDPTDVDVMVQAVKASKEFLTASAWKGFVLSPTADLAGATTDAALEAYVRNSTSTVFHPVGSARMTSGGSTDGVVTPSLLVKNVTGLRIVDASIFPFIPASHPQACVYAVAERAADLIKAAWA